MRDRGKAQEAMLVAQSSKLAQQIADVQNHVATIPTSLPEYRSKLSSDILLGFYVFCCRLLYSARENV